MVLSYVRVLCTLNRILPTGCQIPYIPDSGALKSLPDRASGAVSGTVINLIYSEDSNFGAVDSGYSIVVSLRMNTAFESAVSRLSMFIRERKTIVFLEPGFSKLPNRKSKIGDLRIRPGLHIAIQSVGRTRPLSQALLTLPLEFWVFLFLIVLLLDRRD